jgi:hypothetical protein
MSGCSSGGAVLDPIVCEIYQIHRSIITLVYWLREVR